MAPSYIEQIVTDAKDDHRLQGKDRRKIRSQLKTRVRVMSQGYLG